MKSERAKQLLNNGRFHVFCLKGELPKQLFSPEGKYIEYAQGVLAVELAEQEAEERMRTKAHKIILDMMTGIFHGDMPRNIADEFIQKLTEDEVD